MLNSFHEVRADATWKEDNTIPFRVSCKVCAKVASLWLSWFFPALSPTAGAKARWRLTSVRSFIPTWGRKERKQCSTGQREVREQRYSPVPYTFGSKSWWLGPISCRTQCVVFCLGVLGRQLYLDYCGSPSVLGKLTFVNMQFPSTAAAERSWFFTKTSLCKTSCY